MNGETDGRTETCTPMYRTPKAGVTKIELSIALDKLKVCFYTYC